jgi:preprotein translocase subunit SecY
MVFVLVYIVVFVERAQRRIVVQYPKGMAVGGRAMAMKNSYFPLKVNSSGVMPPILASSLLMLPLTILQFLANSKGVTSGWLSDLRSLLSKGGLGYLTIYGLLIFAFTFFYIGLTFNPDETAENLKKNGAFIAGIRPGKSTADYLGFVMKRLTFLSACYLVFLCVIPEILTSELGVQFILGGTSLLIVVTVIMETISQIQSHLVAYQYEGLIKKAQLKGRL